jgi:hypothetical protein
LSRRVGAPNSTPKNAATAAEIGSISQNDTVKWTTSPVWATRPSHWNGSQNVLHAGSIWNEAKAP